jgi:phage baseplate assembly protein V
MRTDHPSQFDLREVERRVANLIMFGTVIDVDSPSGRARVKIGDLTTAKLPWMSPRMGSRKDWAAPVAGEQVLVLCHNGDPAQGVIVASLGSAANPNPSSNPLIFKTVYSDGTFVQVDLDTHEMSIGCAGAVSVVADGNVRVVSGGRVKVEAAGDVEVDTLGSLSATAAVAAAVTAPNINLTGAVKITGVLEVTGATTLQAATVLGTALVPGGNQF